MLEKAQALKAQFEEKVNGATVPADLEQLRIEFLGKKGPISSLMGELRNIPNEQKKEAGQIINDVKQFIEEAIANKRTELVKLEEERLINSAEDYDVTFPIDEVKGSYHPITLVQREVEDIFAGMGFSIEDYDEIVDDYHCFEALNIPKHHPARDMQDSFFLENKNVLRTQTSAIQIRAMETDGVPIKMFGVGSTYRKEWDATHGPMFGQIEGLYIDENITMSDLIADVRAFLSRFFGISDVQLRIRPSFFPFTDPSIEIDLKWHGDKWLEIMGAGMVHPNVLRNCGIDPDMYQGFAFGFGWDRLAMLKYNLNDIRQFYDNDVRWLKKAGF